MRFVSGVSLVSSLPKKEGVIGQQWAAVPTCLPNTKNSAKAWKTWPKHEKLGQNMKKLGHNMKKLENNSHMTEKLGHNAYQAQKNSKTAATNVMSPDWKLSHNAYQAWKTSKTTATNINHAVTWLKKLENDCHRLKKLENNCHMIQKTRNWLSHGWKNSKLTVTWLKKLEIDCHNALNILKNCRHTVYMLTKQKNLNIVPHMITKHWKTRK